MRKRLLSGLIFALSMFLIPLLALPTNLETMKLSNSKNSYSNAETDLQTPPILEDETEESVQPKAVDVVLDDGGFRILDTSTGKILTVSARDYVRGALAAELPPTFHPEAMKAQAVAAHTYALHVKASQAASPDPALKGADFSAEPKNWKSYTTEKIFRERYGDLADAYWKAICEAADEVGNYVVTYEGEPIVAAYCSMSSGQTEDAANVWAGGRPYLTPVDSFGDTVAPDYQVEELFTAQQVEKALLAAYPKMKLGSDPAGWFRVEERSDSGYVTRLTAGDTTLHGKELRTALDLRSSDFTVTWDGANFIFQVKGYGHGVGLSQYGADYMARQGETFDEILLHYYPGTSLALISPL